MTKDEIIEGTYETVHDVYVIVGGRKKFWFERSKENENK